MIRTNSNYIKTHDRYLYQGSEMDKEIKGDGNSYTTTFRQLDPRLGRWMSLDPVFQAYQSPYNSMDNNPILLNDPLGDFTKNRAERLRNRAIKKGFDVTSLKQIGDKNNWGFEISKENEDKTGSYTKFMLKNKSFKMDESNFELYSNYMIRSTENEFYSFSFSSIQDINLAVASFLIDKGRKMTKSIVESRSGYTSGSLGKGSSKIYNKNSARLTYKGLTVLGHALNVYGFVNSELDYRNGTITKGRRDYNRLNTITSTIFPIYGIPIALGDYLGQKYSNEIEYQVTKGELNQLMIGVFDIMGLQTTPYKK